MVRRLVGGDDVEPSVLEWQAGRIRSQEEDVSSIARRGARQRGLLRVDVDAYRAYAERIGDEQCRRAVERCVDHFHRLDVLLCCAGVSMRSGELPREKGSGFVGFGARSAVRA